MSAQPNQRLNRDDRANPDKSPFGGADVFLVEFGREEISKENGPNNGKGPDVCAELERKRIQQLRVLNLRTFDQGRHLEVLGPARARNPGGDAATGRLDERWRLEKRAPSAPSIAEEEPRSNHQITLMVIWRRGKNVEEDFR